MKTHSVLGPILVALAFVFAVTQVAEAAGTPAGTVISTRASATFTTQTGAAYSTVYSGYVTVTVAQVAALNVASTPQNQTVHDSTTVYYPLTITNSGNGNDAFTLSASSSSTPAFARKYYHDVTGNGVFDGAAVAITSIPSIAADVNYKIIVAVTVPKNPALQGTTDATVVTATSVHTGSVSAAATLNTIISTTYFSDVSTGLSVSPTNPTIGGTVTYTFTITNTGSAPATDVVISIPFINPLNSVSPIASSPAATAGTGNYYWGFTTINQNDPKTVSITFRVGATIGINFSEYMDVVYTSGGQSYSVRSSTLNSTTIGGPTGYRVTSSNYSPLPSTAVTITAQLVDLNGNAVTTAGKTVTWTKSDVNGSFSTPTSITNASGIATITFTSHSVAGTPTTITATDNSSPQLTGTSSTITATAVGAAHHFNVTSSSYTPVAGSPVTITAQLVDANNYAVSSAAHTATWTKSDANGSLSAASSNTDANGIATITFTTHTVMGTLATVTATDNVTSSITGTTANITTTVGTAAKYLVTSTDNAPVAGTAVTITAQLADMHNNPVTTQGNVVTWSKNGAGGSFSSVTSTTGANGQATVTFTTGTIVGTDAVTGSTVSTGSITGTSATISTVAGAATKYIVSSSGSLVAGSAMTITAQLADANDNPVSTLSPGKLVTWTKSDANGSFSAATSNTNANGLATVTFTSHTVSGTSTTITATDNSSPALSGTSASITTIVGAASKYIVTSSTSTPVAGTSVDITARLTDANGNAVTTSGKTVTWSKSNAGGSFASSTSQTNTSGIATVVFTANAVAGIATTVTATDNSTPNLSGTSGTITTRTLTTPHHYIITSSKSNPIAGSEVTITAQLVDAGGQTVPLSGKVVAWSQSPLSAGTFLPLNSVTDANGAAIVVFTTSMTVGTSHTVTGTDAENLTGNITITTIAAPAVILTPATDAKSADPDETLLYALTVTNNGGAADIIELSYSSDQSWMWEFFKDINTIGSIDAGDVLLTDHNSNGIVDTDVLAAGGTMHILARKVIPVVAADGTKDVNTVTVRSATDNSKNASSVLTTTVNLPIVEITRGVSPTGAVVPGTVLTYTITYKNTGTGKAYNLQGIDGEPTNTLYVPGSVTLDGVSKADADVVTTVDSKKVITVALPSPLIKDASHTVTFQVTVK